MIDDEGSVEGENECGASGLQDSVSDGGMGSLGPEYPGDSGSVPASPVRFGTPVRSPYPRSRSSSLSDSGMDHSSIVSPTVLSDWGRGRGGRRGRYRGTRRSSVRGRGRSETRDLSLPVASSHPSALSDPSSGRVRRGGRDRSRGRGARGGRRRGRSERSLSPEPVTFPNVAYSFSNPPPFTGPPQGPNFSMRLGEKANALSFFSLFFDDALLEFIAEQTNLYAEQHPYNRVNVSWVDTNVDELRLFLGIVISTGIVVLPNLHDYWKQNSIMSQPGIVAGMSRNRFAQLCGRLHFNDNRQQIPHGSPGYDRLFKIRPVIDDICEKSNRLYNPGRNLSVDEAMVKFKGRSSLKQYQPLKPIKRGFKIWCLGDSQTGYVHNFIVYTGKEDGGPVLNLGHKVVMGVSKHILGKGYHLYFDNYFSSVGLAVSLLQRATTCVATTRPSRTGFPHGEITKESVAGHSRGMTHSVTFDNKVHCFVWLDARPCFFIDTEMGCTGLPHSVLRKLRSGSSIRVPCPPAVVAYNEHMGGVDLADQIRRFNSCTHKSSRRWYLRLFWFVLDLAIDNAFVLQCQFNSSTKGKGIKGFREELATDLLSTYKCRQRSGRQTQERPARCVERHFPARLDNQGDCEVCSRPKDRHRSNFGCKDCGNVHLCIDPCFRIYHSVKYY